MVIAVVPERPVPARNSIRPPLRGNNVKMGRQAQIIVGTEYEDLAAIHQRFASLSFFQYEVQLFSSAIEDSANSRDY
jgi:hypothetical protein